MPVDPKRLKELFLAASEMPPGDERAALLDRECGIDVELRRRLEVLLRAHDESGGFLAQPAEARERRAGVHGDRFFHFTWVDGSNATLSTLGDDGAIVLSRAQRSRARGVHV